MSKGLLKALRALNSAEAAEVLAALEAEKLRGLVTTLLAETAPVLSGVVEELGEEERTVGIAKVSAALSRGRRSRWKHPYKGASVLGPVDFDKDILRLRRAVGMTQVEFARFLSVSPRTVARWEAGETVPQGAAIQGRLLECGIYDVGVEPRPVGYYTPEEEE